MRPLELVEHRADVPANMLNLGLAPELLNAYLRLGTMETPE